MTTPTLPPGYITLSVAAAMDYSDYFHRRSNLQAPAAKLAAWRVYSDVDAYERRYQAWISTMIVAA